MPSQILIGRESSLALVTDILAGQKRLFAVLQKDDREELPEREQLYEVGILAEIERAFKLPDGNMQLVAWVFSVCTWTNSHRGIPI